MPRTKESGRADAIRRKYVYPGGFKNPDIEFLLAERDALVLVAEAVVNGEWEAARELADAALERHP